MPSRLVRYIFIPLSSLLVSCASDHIILNAHELTLDSIFTDHMVLQSGKPVTFRGRAAPNSEVAVEIADQVVVSRSDDDGRWAAEFKPLSVGGSYRLKVASHGKQVTVNDIAVGEVWLCSGQSNMDRPLSWDKEASVEIQAASNANLRLLHIRRNMRINPADKFANNEIWRQSSPASVSEFSAVCYYFGKRLQEKLNMPIGLIAASWGGSPIEAWIDLDSFSVTGLFPEQIEDLTLYRSNAHEGRRAFEDRQAAWWRRNDPNSKAHARSPWFRLENEKQWKSIRVPGRWRDTELSDFDGVVWYQKIFDLPKEWKENDLVLSLGRIDDRDTVWINGVQVGASYSYARDRKYVVPKGILKGDDNLISVRVLDIRGDGGFIDDALNITLGDGEETVVSLSGEWRAIATVDASVLEPYLTPPDENPRAPTVLFNGMINPVGSFPMRGVLWYQGETNARYPDSYESLLDALGASWRKSIAEDLAFLIVQLPQYIPSAEDDAHGNWWRIREAQDRFTQKDNRAELVITIDSGDPDDIHPQNKRLVGERAAETAYLKFYGGVPVARRPAVVGVRRLSDKIEIMFDEEIVSGDALPLRGFELCEGGNCRLTKASYSGRAVFLPLLSSDKIDEIRFAISDAPNPNLFSASGWPAAPFRYRVD